MAFRFAPPQLFKQPRPAVGLILLHAELSASMMRTYLYMECLMYASMQMLGGLERKMLCARDVRTQMRMVLLTAGSRRAILLLLSDCESVRWCQWLETIYVRNTFFCRFQPSLQKSRARAM